MKLQLLLSALMLLVGLSSSIMVGEGPRIPAAWRNYNATRNSSIITRSRENSSTSLRDLFDFVFDSSNQSEDWRDAKVTPRPSIISKAHSSTFRPSSSILYLTPPKPRHIASIHSSLESIQLDRRTAHLILSWSVIVMLKPNETTAQQPKVHKRQIVSAALEEASNQTAAVAKVEEERNPLKWIIHIRRYGEPNRERFQIIDRENTLDPPYTGNKTYHHKLSNFHFHTDSSYEVCIQSVNGGKMQESQQLKQHFPVDAHTELAGKSNPLFVCKEVLIKKQTLEPQVEDEVELLNRQKSEVRGRLAEGDGAHIEVSEQAQDAFVVYTAITSGSTTVLLLIVVALFCCCKCNQKKNKQNEYHHHYNRAPSADSAYY